MTVLTLDLARQYLRYQVGATDDDADTSQDEVITRALAAGQEWVERYTGLLLTQREVRQVERSFCGPITLSFGPVNAETPASIDYLGSDGTAGTVDDARLIETGADGRYSLWPAVNASWPVADYAGGIVVTYQAGYADPDDVPAGLLEALLVYAGMRDDAREGGETPDQWNALWSIIAPYRRVGLA